MNLLPNSFLNEHNYGVETDFNHITCVTAEEKEGFTHLHTAGAMPLSTDAAASRS